MTENKENIYICRCEEVTLAEIEEAIAQGAKTLTAVKVRTGAGMGVCQGMTCRRNIERMLREGKADPSLACQKHSPYRFPVRTVGIGELAADAPTEQKEDSHEES